MALMVHLLLTATSKGSIDRLHDVTFSFTNKQISAEIVNLKYTKGFNGAREYMHIHACVSMWTVGIPFLSVYKGLFFPFFINK